MNTYGGVGSIVQLVLYLILALVRGEWLVSRPNSSTISLKFPSIKFQRF